MARTICINAWFLRLIKGGRQNTHIYPYGLVSAVLYLKTILNSKNNEGALYCLFLDMIIRYRIKII